MSVSDGTSKYRPGLISVVRELHQKSYTAKETSNHSRYAIREHAVQINYYKVHTATVMLLHNDTPSALLSNLHFKGHCSKGELSFSMCKIHISSLPRILDNLLLKYNSELFIIIYQ